MLISPKRNPPFRAEHVGSLLRPSTLTKAFRRFSAGDASADEFRTIQDTCIREVVTLQEEAGLRSITDGEFRRASYWAHFVAAVDGLGVKPAIFDFHGDDAASREVFLAPYVEGKVRRTRPISADEFSFLQDTTTQTPKLTMPSPPTMHFWGDRQGVRDAYGDRHAFFDDLAAVYREEIAHLASLGARYIQIDDVPLAMLCDAHVCDVVRGIGEDPNALVDEYIDLINASLAGRPDDMTVGMHLCRGNFKGKWLSEGGYDVVAQQLFTGTSVDAFFLEYDSPRAGGFAPLQHLPENKTAVLGLVTTKRSDLESRDALQQRLREASEYVPLDRLAISPQCGFSSAVSGNPVTVADEIRKLELVVDVARRVWNDV